jgi:hypothetical protein
VLLPTIRVSLNDTAEAKKILITRGVDHGGHQLRCMDLHACPTMGANYHGL